MGRRVGPGDFEQAGRLKKHSEERGVCYRCRGYRTEGNKIKALFPDPRTLVDGTATVVVGGDDGWTAFLPLADEPELFLKFARLHRARGFEASALNFCNRYGIPGFVRRPHKAEERHAAEAGIGAAEITFGQMWEESRLAWAILCLYEAAHDESARRVQEILTQYHDVLNEWPVYSPGRDIGDLDAAWFAMIIATQATGEMVQLLCRLGLHVMLPSGTPPPVSEGWTFDNLLGAMYLQMFWLMASGEDLARCEHCGLVMSLGHAAPGGRKRRQDKRFCDDACRQAHHRAKKGS